MYAVFEPLIEQRNAPVVETDTRTAEMIKYANTASSQPISASLMTSETSVV